MTESALMAEIWSGRMPEHSPREDDIHFHRGFRPLSDQVLVRPLPSSDRLRSRDLIRIPGSHDRGRLDNKLGTVLALGPGDPVAVKCDLCEGEGRTGCTIDWDLDTGENVKFGGQSCPDCLGLGFTGYDRTSFEVSVGDTVLYAPRGWAEIEIAGEALIVLHEDQHLIGIVDPDTVLFAEDATTKKKAPDWIR